MPWFRFDKDFDWYHSPRAFKAYKAGTTDIVTTECAEEAKTKGVGSVVQKPENLKSTKDGKIVEIND